MSDEVTLPNPGSKLAREHGCRCPVLDNYYGKGMPGEDGPVFWINADCDMHGETPNEEEPRLAAKTE